MDTNSVLRILNLYSFVKTEKNKTDKDYVNQRIKEHMLMSKQRNAVQFCKNILSVNTSDLSKIINEEKELMEKCLKDNFLRHDPNYFGQRDTIFLDLHNY